jgi:hypothetical protein
VSQFCGTFGAAPLLDCSRRTGHSAPDGFTDDQGMSEDIKGPVVQVRPGCAVSIILRGDEKVTAGEGRLGLSRGFGIEVELKAAAYLKPQAEVILAAGEPGKRAVTLARFKQMRGNTAVFMRQSPWRPVDARNFARYPARIRARVQGRDGDEVEAVTLDVSIGGMAVAVPAPVNADEVVVSVGKRAVNLPCKVVGKQETKAGDATIVHLAFGDLSDEARDAIELLVARLRIQADEEASHAA